MNSMKRLERRNSLPRNERGMVLLVVMVMLVLISLIAIVGAEDSQLQTRMSSNSQHYEVATYNAETLLIRLEKQLEEKLKDRSWTVSNFNASANGLYNLADGSATRLDPLDEDSWDTRGKRWSGADDETGRYIIEYLGRIGASPLNVANTALDRRLHAFRITVRGESRSASAVIQSEVHFGLQAKTGKAL